jgi:hypothetical protein
MTEYINVEQFVSGPILEFGDVPGLPGQRWKLNKPTPQDRFKTLMALKNYAEKIDRELAQLKDEAEERREAEEKRLREDEETLSAWRFAERERLAADTPAEELEAAVEKAVEGQIITAAEEAGRIYIDKMEDAPLPPEYIWEEAAPAVRLAVYLTPETDPALIVKHFPVELVQYLLARVDEVKSGDAAKKALKAAVPLRRT